MVVAWLATCVTKDIHQTIMCSDYATDIWKELEARYGQVDTTRVFELKKEIAQISQGSLDIVAYFNKLKQI